MATKNEKIQAQMFRALIQNLTPAMQRAFFDSVASLYAGVDYVALNRALAGGDVDGAVAALRIEESAFLPMYQAHQQAYIQGATETVASFRFAGIDSATAAGIRFDMFNPRAEAFLATTSAEMVKQVADDTRRAVRESILRGYQAGMGPKDIGINIAGRVVSGVRRDGVLGLDANRAYRLDMVSEGMRTADGVAGLVIKRADGTLVLRYKVNKATEAAILSAYRKGEAVPESVRIRSYNQFRNALLKSRADTVAKVETARAVMSGRDEEWRQTLEKLGRDPAEVIKTWQHGSGGQDPRIHHVQMNNKSVTGLDTPFVFSNGAMLQYAHDPSGAASETINCTCDSTFRLPPRMEDLL